jgi:hypothetical protein
LPDFFSVLGSSLFFGLPLLSVFGIRTTPFHTVLLERPSSKVAQL